MVLEVILFIVLAGLVIGAIFHVARRSRRHAGGATERAEAYFKAMFPELQPHFHPEKVLRFMRARSARKMVADGDTWRFPPGFETASAVVALREGRERIRLADPAGATLAEFIYERQGRGAVLRVGRGKLTLEDDAGNPRVRYWHPEREFKWSRKDGWRFTTPVADQSFDSDRGGSRFSSERDPSSPSSAASTVVAAGAAAMVSGAGGAFAGGGASESWDSNPAGAADAGTTAY